MGHAHPDGLKSFPDAYPSSPTTCWARESECARRVEKEHHALADPVAFTARPQPAHSRKVSRSPARTPRTPGATSKVICTLATWSESARRSGSIETTFPAKMVPACRATCRKSGGTREGTVARSCARKETAHKTSHTGSRHRKRRRCISTCLRGSTSARRDERGTNESYAESGLGTGSDVTNTRDWIGESMREWRANLCPLPLAYMPLRRQMRPGQ